MGGEDVKSSETLEQTCLFSNPPELEGSESSQEHQQQVSARPGRGRWLTAALAAAALAAVALCALSLRSGQVAERTGHELVADLELDMLARTPVQELEEVELDEPPVWINRGSGASNDTVELADGPPVEEEVHERRLSHTCQSRLHHVDQISRQRLAPHSTDSLFPPSMQAIAESNANCGDSAQNIFESCSKYNHWRKFQDVAKSMHKHFQVLEGPNWHDVDQGELGTCYFLAALASVAYTDPKVIEDMFVERHKWAQNIFTTRWLVNGKVLDVEVDNNVPARSWSTYFVQPSQRGEWWPVILEKAWAKIAGTYKAAEGGLWPNPVLAMTAAPVARYHHDKKSVHEVMQVMEMASDLGWPMGAGTGPNCVKYGLSRSHAYSVFKVFNMAGRGKVVKVYNPWHKDNYHGSIPNPDKSDGVFTMTAAEYHDAFDCTSIAEVHTNYKASTKLIQNELSKTTAWEFDIPFSGHFLVSVSWPISRMFRGCKFKEPKVTLAIQKQGSSEPIMAERPAYGISTTSAKVHAGAGHYTATVAAVFPAGNEVHEANLVIYAPQPVHIQPSSGNPTEQLLNMFGATENGKACTNVFIKGYGNFILKMDVLVSNVPTYWSVGDEDLVYWAPDQKMWLIIQGNYLHKVQGGELWSFAKVTKAHMSCGCKDNPKGVAGFNGVYCNMVKGADAVYANVKCEGAEHSDLVKRFCPVTCSASFCRSGSSSSPAPAPAPAPAASQRSGGGGVQQQCEDEEPTHVKMNGKQATCTMLKNHCLSHSFVKAKCCNTCAKQAESGGLSDDTKCKDHHPPGLMNNRGRHFKSCAELKGSCAHSSTVTERCCATCEKDQEFKDQCQDSPQPNLKTTSGKTFPCSGWKPHCSHPAVKEECCKTCSR